MTFVPGRGLVRVDGASGAAPPSRSLAPLVCLVLSNLFDPAAVDAAGLARVEEDVRRACAGASHVAVDTRNPTGAVWVLFDDAAGAAAADEALYGRSIGGRAVAARGMTLEEFTTRHGEPGGGDAGGGGGGGGGGDGNDGGDGDGGGGGGGDGGGGAVTGVGRVVVGGGGAERGADGAGSASSHDASSAPWGHSSSPRRSRSRGEDREERGREERGWERGRERGHERGRDRGLERGRERGLGRGGGGADSRVGKSRAESALGRSSRDARTVFISQLVSKVGEAELAAYFGEAGRIASVALIRDKATGRSMGHAYVEFEEPDAAALALLLNGQKLCSTHAACMCSGFPVLVKRAVAEGGHGAAGAAGLG